MVFALWVMSVAFLLVGMQTNSYLLHADEHEEDEMHWQPLTGLPEPLSTTDRRSHVAATRPSQLEKQVWCHT